MRALGIDFGQRRIGLALSDATGTLARPWMTMNAGQSPIASADALTRLIHDADTRRDHDLEDVSTIVVGVPRRLNGEDTQQTGPAREFARRLQQAFPDVRVVEQDERLTSHEADQLLAEREPDWRRRKQKLDSAAAALILQDYLDQRRRLDVSISTDGFE